MLVKTAVLYILLVENHPSFSMLWGGQWNSMGNISDVMQIIANQIIGKSFQGLYLAFIRFKLDLFLPGARKSAAESMLSI